MLSYRRETAQQGATGTGTK